MARMATMTVKNQLLRKQQTEHLISDWLMFRSPNRACS